MNRKISQIHWHLNQIEKELIMSKWQTISVNIDSIRRILETMENEK